MKKNRLAFSLVELAVVVLIIGIIAAGIMKGSSIIRSSRIASARSLTMQSHINEIPGMVAWYETTMIDSFDPSQASDSTQLSEWHDISPGSIAEQKNMLTRTASSAVVYKAEGINDLPSVSFSSGNLSLSAFYQGAIGKSTIFIVMRPTVATGSNMTLLDSYSTSSEIFITDDNVAFNLGSEAQTGLTNPPSFVINTNYILVAYFDNTNSRAFVNNAASMAGGAAISPGTNPLDGLKIGSSLTPDQYFTGYISEVIIYDRQLSLDERKSVMSYLSKKYKIAVTGL